MNGIGRVIRCEAGNPEGSILFLSDRISLAEGQTRSVETLTRVVTFDDPFYGTVRISHDMLAEMVSNFDKRTYGQDIAVDVAHISSNGAGGFIRRLFLDGGKLRGEIEWTPFGIEAVTQRGFRYFSAEYQENYKDPETGAKHGALLMGAGLTTRPRVKNLDPVDPEKLKLSFDDDERGCAVSSRVKKLLTEEITSMWEKLIKQLAEKLGGMKLAEAIITELKGKFALALEGVTEEAQANALLAGFVSAGEQVARQLAEVGRDQTVKVDLHMPDMGGGKSLSEDDVKRLMAEQLAAQQAQADQAVADREAAVKRFTEAVSGAEGLKILGEEDMQVLLAAADLITSDMSDEQITALAEHQIRIGSQMAVVKQLADRGFAAGGPAGQVHVDVVTAGDAKKLEEAVISQLKKSSSAINGQLRLSETLEPFAERVLAQFDAMHAPQIHAEVKALAGGSTGIGDTNLPVGFQRTVIREALSDLRVLELVQTLTDFSATATTQIPYETRDTTDVANDGIVFEGQPIHRASVTQAMDTAYILPMKLAFIISNEVMHFSRASAIDWDAFARNVESNARVMRELIVRRICNELQRSADAYGAVAVSNEAIDTQLTGSVSTVKTANYPIVRPHQQQDLQGNNVGAAENPITVRLNGAAIGQYDGSGTQSAGTYYRVTNYNLGYIQFVSEAGVPVTPSNSAGADDVSYSYATNVAKFDLDVPSGDTLEHHLNGLLQAVGARKAVMLADRFVTPDFQLMSPVLNDTATNAENFVASQKRDGADTSAQGDLTAIKAVPAFATNAPGIDLGDERIILGGRGTLTYTVAKPFVTGQPFEAVDATTGKPIGKKQAYGEEYSALKVPTPIRNRLTSVLAYSFTGR